MNTRDNLQRAHFYSTCALALFPLLPAAGMSIAVMIWALLSFAAILYEKKTPQHRSAVMVWLSVSLFVFYGISLLYTSDVSEGLDRLSRMSPLLLFPLLTYYLPYDYGRRKVTQLLKLFVAGLILTLVIALGRMLADGFLEELTTAPHPVTFTRIRMEAYTHLHPSYLSLFLCFAFLIVYTRVLQKTSGRRGLSVIVLVFLLAFIFLLSAKMSIIALAVSMLWLLFREGKNLLRNLARLFAVMTAAVILIMVIPTTRERFGDLIQAVTSTKIDPKNPDSVRRGIYASAIKVIGNDPVLGTGIGDANAALKAQYKQDKLRLAYRKNFNSHNQYLDIWLSAGMMPLLLFLIAIGISFRLSLVNKNYIQGAFIIMMSICLLTENILSRQTGVLFFSFFNALFLFQKPAHALRFCINGRFLTQRTSGVQRFAREISRELLPLQKEVILLSPFVHYRDAGPFQVKVLRPFGSHLWQQLTLPVYCSLRGNPVLLNPGNTAPVCYKNNITVVHDLSVFENPEWFKKSFSTWYAWLLPVVIRKSKAVVTVSESAAAQIRSRFPEASTKIHVCYNGIAASLSAPTGTNPVAPDESFVLTIGSNDPRKNLDLVINAFLASGVTQKLVIAGDFSSTVFRDNDTIDAYRMDHEKITFIDSPDDQTLLNLYRTAHAFIFIPAYEGFGLPVLEALHAECPVLASDITVFRELYEGAVLFAAPGDVGKVAEGIRKILNDTALRETLKTKGQAAVEKYSYAASANKISAIIEELNTDGSSASNR